MNTPTKVPNFFRSWECSQITSMTCEEAMKLLIQHKAEVNVQGIDQPPLHMACALDSIQAPDAPRPFGIQLLGVELLRWVRLPDALQGYVSWRGCR